MSKNREVKLGEVAVDSGQLVVCDPSYLESEWKRDTEPFNNRIYIDSETGTRWQFCYPGEEPQPGNKSFPGSYEIRVLECDNLTPNDLIESGRWVREKITPPFRGEFSYRGCCDLTCSTKD